MWKHKTKWLVRGGRKVRCYLCGKKILAEGDLFLFHGDTGYYSHQSCQAESTTISGNERRRAVKKIAVGAAVVGAIAAGAGKFLDVSSQSKNSPAAQTILTSQGLIPPALTSDPANPVPGQMWYRSDAGVEAHFDGVQNRVVYSSEINDGNVHVTSKGIINGLSVLPNDGTGWFGPDTTLNATSPGQYGSPYTETLGIQEGGNYANSLNGGTVKLLPGIYLIDTAILCSLWNAVTLEGTGGLIFEGGVADYMGGTTIAPSDNFDNKTSVSLAMPTVGTYTYYPLIYVLGTGAGTNPAGTNLIFRNFLLSGVNAFGGTPKNYILGLYADGIWNAVVDHVDTQVLWYGKYFSLNSSSGGENWYLNSVDVAPFDIGTFWGADEGAMVNCSVQGNSTGGHGSGLVFSFFINGLNASVPATASNITYGASTLYLASYCHVSNIMRENGYSGGPAIMIGQFCSITGGYITDFDRTADQPIFGGNGGIITNDHFSNLTIVGNNNSSYPSTLASISFGGSASKLYGNEVVFENITLLKSTSAGTSYWNDPIYSTSANSGYVAPLVLKNIYGLGPFSPTTPSVPASATAQENTNPYAVDIYVYGGAVTEIQITRNGTAYTVFSVSTAIAMSGQHFPLNNTDSITITYSTAPTWEWLSD